MSSNSKKTSTKRRRKLSKQGYKRKRKLRKDGSTPAFPIHPEEDKK